MPKTDPSSEPKHDPKSDAAKAEKAARRAKRHKELKDHKDRLSHKDAKMAEHEARVKESLAKLKARGMQPFKYERHPLQRELQDISKHRKRLGVEIANVSQMMVLNDQVKE